MAGQARRQEASEHRAFVGRRTACDSLTTLMNRRFFTERLDQALTRLGRVHQDIAVVYLDLDGLKSINDRYGHDTGDQLLQIAAARLRGALRAQDMVCRLGGDEFACLLIDSPSRPQLEHLACKLFDTVSAPMQIGGQSLVVCASIGIATGVSGSNGAMLLKQADTAMYCAKREQTGYAFFGLRTLPIAGDGHGARKRATTSAASTRPRSSISLSEPHRRASTPTTGSACAASDSDASRAGP
ncbi:MAG TPA: GGDEF domain-containing protein [Burkholderiaceae bacterium]|nr:GGDEF domain-containing protein [Burkholderiaceae bacterium]